MNERQQSFPLSRREKMTFAAAGLVLDLIGVAIVADGEAAGMALVGLGLGSLLTAKWGEFRSEDSARPFDVITATHRSANGTPL